MGKVVCHNSHSVFLSRYLCKIYLNKIQFAPVRMSLKRHRGSDRRSSRGSEADISDLLHGILVRSGRLRPVLKAEVDGIAENHLAAKGDVIELDDDQPSTSDDVTESTCDLFYLPGLPTLECLASNFLSRGAMRAKFIREVSVGDRICARVTHTKVVTLDVYLVCMLSHFRRVLSTFMANEKFTVMCDKSRNYQRGDYVVVVVKLVNLNENKLEVVLPECENDKEATTPLLTHDQLPSYYREHLEMENTVDNGDDYGDDDRSRRLEYDERSSLRDLRGNPNLGELLSIRIDSRHSALGALVRKNLTSDSLESAEQLRMAQNRRLALGHVERGAELTRAGKCFEAIQCFNKALNVDERCADAYVGRGAACAGSNNYTGALIDLEKALEIEPRHANANRYRCEVLVAHGKELEKEGNVVEARRKYEDALRFSDGKNEHALNAMQKLGVPYSPRNNNGSSRKNEIRKSNGRRGEGIEVVEILSDDDGGPVESSGRRRKRLSRANDIVRDTEASASFRRKSVTSSNVDRRSISKESDNKRHAADVSTPADDDEFSENRRKLREMEAFIAQLKK